MPFYLMRFSYTPEAWARLIKKPEDRREVARAIVEKLGGKLHGFWYGFGEHDGFVLIEAPNNVSAAAFTVGISAGGSLRSAETTVLLTVEEAIEMLKKAQGLPLQTSWSQQLDSELQLAKNSGCLTARWSDNPTRGALA